MAEHKAKGIMSNGDDAKNKADSTLESDNVHYDYAKQVIRGQQLLGTLSRRDCDAIACAMDWEIKCRNGTAEFLTVALHAYTSAHLSVAPTAPRPTTRHQ